MTYFLVVLLEERRRDWKEGEKATEKMKLGMSADIVTGKQIGRAHV